MNTADRLIAILDTALRRRFHFEEVPPDPDLLAQVELANFAVDLSALLRAINDRLKFLLGPDHLLGHGWFMNLTDKAGLDAAMGRKVVPLLREYCHEDLARVRAVLGGGDGFLRAEELQPPPGLSSDFVEPSEFPTNSMACPRSPSGISLISVRSPRSSSAASVRGASSLSAVMSSATMAQ